MEDVSSTGVWQLPYALLGFLGLGQQIAMTAAGAEAGATVFLILTAAPVAAGEQKQQQGAAAAALE